MADNGPLAEKARDWDRPLDPKRDVHSADLAAAAAAEGVEYATDDLVIRRPDLGPESATFVAKGERIPRELADFPRLARADWPPAEQRKKG
jgi:hypothetical protein